MEIFKKHNVLSIYNLEELREWIQLFVHMFVN